MDDIEVCQWIIEQNEKLRVYVNHAAMSAKPLRLEVFHKLLALDRTMVELFWEINIAREREHLERIAYPHP